MVTPEGKFLDPLADKILVSSAFISFAIIGVIDYWMVALIIFRDLFVTGLRMAMNREGLEMVTSNIAKAKTIIQINIIGFILIVLGMKGLALAWASPILEVVKEYHLIYNFTLLVTLFTVLTGFTYLYSNRNAIIGFLKSE
jgi:CDP-diacylglycerol--glycerol-3-phosphate 3-phosphatidyltransferase